MVLTSNDFTPAYQVGGSLPPQAPTYVRRQADETLFQSLLKQEFCYVFNARQMGKSSLRVQVALQLRAAGVRCATIDLTEIGTQEITSDQWYASIAAFLVNRFELKIHLTSWWQARSHLSRINRLGEFLETILLAQIDSPIVIFIDEIDSVLSLKFSTDDFFALIRACFNYRTENPAYHRLTFCLLGVTTPSNLIADSSRTPFNIGHAIELRGLQLAECTPLLPGLLVLQSPEAALQRILDWTGGQPFLMQKMCQLVVQDWESGRLQEWESGKMRTPDPADLHHIIDQLVHTHILTHWESQDEPEHLRTIRDRLLWQETWTGRLLGVYQQILESDGIPANDSLDQAELLLTGLVEKQQGILQVKNRIYREVFTLDWVNDQLGKLRPYAAAFNAWMASHQTDASRLLRGQALVDAQQWSQGKHLNDFDYWFLSASEQCDRREAQQVIEAAQAREIQARLMQERQIAKLQRLLLGSLSVALAIAIGVSLLAFQQYRQAKLSEIKALASSSKGFFASNQQLDAMLDAIRAQRRRQELGTTDAQIGAEVDAALRQTVYGTNEFNRLIGHQGAVLSVAISPDEQWIATGSNDKTVKIWQRDGTLRNTLKQEGTVHRVAFSPDSRSIVAGSLDGMITLWRLDGTRLNAIHGHPAPVWGVAFSPNGKLIASASSDKTVKLWQLDGTLQTTLTGHQKAVWAVAFSPDGERIATSGIDQTVRVWSVAGQLLNTLQGHQAPVWDVAFCPHTNLLVSGSGDRTAKLWQPDGTLVKTLKIESPILGVDCSGQGQYIATSGQDNFVQLWKPDGTLIRTLKQHNAVIRDVALSADGLMAASASDDGTVKLWQRNKYLLKPLYSHQATIWEIATSPDGQWIASVSADGTLKLWRADGTLGQTIAGGFRSVAFSSDSRMLVTGDTSFTVQLWALGSSETAAIRRVRTLTGHQASIYAVAISPDGQTIASGGDDRSIKLWSIDGSLRRSVIAHKERIWKLAFSPSGETLASASEEGTVKLWTSDGRAKTTLLGHGGAVWGVAFNPTGDRIASVSRDDTLKLWRLDGSLIKTIPGQSRGLTRVAFSPAPMAFENRAASLPKREDTIATAGVDNTLKLWSSAGELLTTLPGHRGIVISLAFGADGNTLVSGGDEGTVILWDMPKIRALKALEYACDWVRDYLQTNVEVKEGDRNLCP
jgi:WD40 repeat protein